MWQSNRHKRANALGSRNVTRDLAKLSGYCEKNRKCLYNGLAGHGRAFDFNRQWQNIAYDLQSVFVTQAQTQDGPTRSAGNTVWSHVACEFLYSVYLLLLYLTEEDRNTVVGNEHRKSDEILTILRYACGQTDRQTDIETSMLIAIHIGSCTPAE